MFIALFLAIFAHEMGHFISFVKQGIKPKALYALGIAFVNDNGLKIRFVPKFLLMIGGIVIPDHLSIQSKDEEETMVHKFKRVLLAGPKASIIYGVLIILIWILCLFTNIYWLNGFLFTVLIVTSIMTVLAVLSSKVSRAGMYGDFAAEKAFDKDKLFRLTYLIQLTTLIEHDKESMAYFWPSIVEMLETQHQAHSQLYTNLLGQYIYEVAFHGQIACLSIEKKMNSLIRNIPKTEDGLILYLNIIYYYEALNDRTKVIQLLNNLNTAKFKVSDKVLTYYLRLTNHLLGFKDETVFLSQPKNVHTSSYQWVYKPLNIQEELKGIVK
ncbi:M50 family metallopeptidase [Acholeplasma laidlawii]|nr:M50 family metallopeptidase [Acholeplasma laidlawii]